MDASFRRWVMGAVEDHEGRLLLYARRLVGDAEQARDLVQECFLRLCREDRARVEQHLRAWLYAVVRRLAIDRLRRRAREPSAAPAAVAEPAVVDDPGDQLAAAEEQRLLLLALDRLPAGHREVVRLRFQHGLSYREIAEVTGHSEGNVGFLLHHAIKRLRHALAPRPQAID